MHYDVSGLPVGSYNASIQVADNGSSPAAGNSPQAIAVSIVVSNVRADLDHDGDVDLTDFG